jgi:hypothetical protein
MEYLKWVESGSPRKVNQDQIWIAAINLVADVEANEAAGTASKLMKRAKGHATTTLAEYHAKSSVN